MTPDGRAIMNVYRAMIKYAAAYSNTPTNNNATFQVLNPFNFREDIARIDWRPGNNHSVIYATSMTTTTPSTRSARLTGPPTYHSDAS